jgi:undecaprenyl-diphosphatase
MDEVFWCFDKKHGYFLITIGFLGTVINQFLKVLFRIPRPWVKDPNFTIVESAKEAATGYSFPSGHTQSAVGSFGAVARFTKKTCCSRKSKKIFLINKFKEKIVI